MMRAQESSPPDRPSPAPATWHYAAARCGMARAHDCHQVDAISDHADRLRVGYDVASEHGPIKTFATGAYYTRAGHSMTDLTAGVDGSSSSRVWTSRGAMESVDGDELLRRVRRGEVTTLDVRPAEEYLAGHIPGARSIPLAGLKKRLAELPGTGRSSRTAGDRTV